MIYRAVVSRIVVARVYVSVPDLKGAEFAADALDHVPDLSAGDRVLIARVATSARAIILGRFA